MNVSWGYVCVICVGFLVGCGGGGGDGSKAPAIHTSSSSVSSLSSVVASSQSSEQSSALAVSSEGGLSSAGSSLSSPGASSSGSLSSSGESSSSSVASSNSFTVEFKPPVIGAQGSLTQKIGQFFISAAHAASTVRLKPENFALVRINLAGVVQETAQLPVGAMTENADGSWVISWEGKKSIDWLVVADVANPLDLSVGEALIGLRKDLIYAPVTSDYVDVDVTSTEAYQILLRWSENGNSVGGGTGTTFENTFGNAQNEEVVSFFESLVNASQLKIDEQALVANTIESYRTLVNKPVSEYLVEQIKITTDPQILSLAQKFQTLLNTSNSIVGTWSVCDWALNSCHESWLVFTQENTYVSIQTTQPDEGCKQGIETGTYTLNQTTGAFKPIISRDGNDHCGVSDASNTASIVVNGNQFSYKEAQSSQGVPFVKIRNLSTLMSTWISSINNKIEVFILFNTNSFIFATVDVNSGASDLEQGTFENKGAAGNLTVTEWKNKLGNDTYGLSGAKTIKLSITDNLLTITTDLDPSPTKVYKRLQ